MKDAVFGVLLIILTVALARNCTITRDLRDERDVLRKEVFARDTLVHHNDSLVSVLVRDNATARQIADSLNKVLLSFVQDRGHAPAIITRVEFQPVSKTDTVFFDRETNEYTSYYPTPDDWVIRHRLRMGEWGFNVADWDFQPIWLDMVISETQAGLYEAAMTGPGFIRVRNLTVNSLPFRTAQERSPTGFLLGAGAQYKWKDRIFVPTLQAGLVYRDHHFLATGWTSGVGVAYLRRIGRGKK